METNKNKKIAVALFIISGFALFLTAIFVIGSKENLFTPVFVIKTEFESVSGLRTGSTVRFNGINVGKVNLIQILATNKILVEMSIENSVQKFIKKDSRVTIASDGLVGNKIIEISPGTPGSQHVAEGDMLISVKPVEVSDIMASLKQSSDNASEITKDLAEITAKVNSGEGTLGQLINNPSVYQGIDTTFRSFSKYSGQLNLVFAKITGTVDNVSSDIDNLTKQVNKITVEISDIVRKMNSSESIVGTLLTDTSFANNLKDVIKNTNSATKNLENGSFSFAQNMEALKHNFLFKGYFEDIGYWDKTDWEKNMDKKNMELRIKEQQLLKKETELKQLEEKLKLEQKLNQSN